MRLQDAIWVNLIATRCRLLPSVLRISEKDPSIAGCSEVEPSSHGLVNACAAFPSEAHAAHRYAWVNNSATCCQSRLRMTFGSFGLLEGGGILLLTLTSELRSEACRAVTISFRAACTMVLTYAASLFDLARL